MKTYNGYIYTLYYEKSKSRKKERNQERETEEKTLKLWFKKCRIISKLLTLNAGILLYEKVKFKS